MEKSLQGRVAVITGAARGIGRSTCFALAERGAAVAMFDRDAEALQAAADEVAAQGEQVLPVCGDVSNREDIARLFTAVQQRFGRLDVLVNNAAASTRTPFLETDEAALRRTMEISLWGALACSRVAAERFVQQGHGGAIVMVSSVHAERPYTNALGYNAAKAALNHAAASMALEWAGDGIRVNTVEPGWIDTPGEHVHNTEEEIATRGKTLPFGRLGQPDEVAKAIAFLCTDDASYITGAVLRVDGGFALRF